MELDNINGALASQEVAEKKRMEEVEKVDDFDIAKHGGETIDYAAEKRLVRKLDLW
jgi:MFS transporter, ACS family, DAL5 transporter family protein